MNSAIEVRNRSSGMAHYGVAVHASGTDYVAATPADVIADDHDGLVQTQVMGIDAQIYAHRSATVPGALLVGVDAKEGQRVLFVVNDADVLDTTVGVEIEPSLPQPGPAADTRTSGKRRTCA